MDLAYCTRQLSRSAETIRDLVGSLDQEQARWKSAPGKWSALEVICHLYDEEREDFRARIDLVFNQPGTSWPPIDPAGWVMSRGYAERSHTEMLEHFLQERSISLLWLEELSAPEWERLHHHPNFPPISAGDLLASWVAHDLLHIRQLTRIQWDYLHERLAAYSSEYAGEW